MIALYIIVLPVIVVHAINAGSFARFFSSYVSSRRSLKFEYGNRAKINDRVDDDFFRFFNYSRLRRRSNWWWKNPISIVLRAARYTHVGLICDTCIFLRVCPVCPLVYSSRRRRRSKAFRLMRHIRRVILLYNNNFVAKSVDVFLFFYFTNDPRRDSEQTSGAQQVRIDRSKS